MNNTKMRPGILSRKRLTPIHNLKAESYERKPDTEDYSWAAEQIMQFEVMMEIEDMENDRTGICLFRDNSML
jgi:hypothetical protein